MTNSQLKIPMHLCFQYVILIVAKSTLKGILDKTPDFFNANNISSLLSFPFIFYIFSLLYIIFYKRFFVNMTKEELKKHKNNIGSMYFCLTESIFKWSLAMIALFLMQLQYRSGNTFAFLVLNIFCYYYIVEFFKSTIKMVSFSKDIRQL